MAHHIYEHDNMMAVGQRPWHGLGVVLQQPPATGLEALQIAGLDWKVFKDPMFRKDGRQVVVTGPMAEKYPGRHGMIIREDTDEILGVVGPSFEPLQNQQMAKLFDPLIQEGLVSIETCGSLFNGRRVWMQALIKDSEFDVKPGDTIKAYLLAAHGHDGSLAMRFGPTLTRVVCHNTMSAAVNGGESKLVKCLHTKNLEANLQVLRDAFVSYKEAFALTADQYRLLASRGVSRADLREYARLLVGADRDENEWTSSQLNKIGLIVGAAMDGRGNDGSSWFSAYNGASEYLTWNAGRSSETRLNALWFGENAKVNQKALDLAVEMATAA